MTAEGSSTMPTTSLRFAQLLKLGETSRGVRVVLGDNFHLCGLYSLSEATVSVFRNHTPSVDGNLLTAAGNPATFATHCEIIMTS